MEAVSYALCEYKCKKSKSCARYINRKTGNRTIINFKPVCNANNNYQWFYKADTNIVNKTKEKRRK